MLPEWRRGEAKSGSMVVVGVGRASECIWDDVVNQQVNEVGRGSVGE